MDAESRADKLRRQAEEAEAKIKAGEVSPPSGAYKQPEESKYVGPIIGVKSEEPEEFECPSCGAPVSIATTKCPECGEEFEDEEDISNTPPEKSLEEKIEPPKPEIEIKKEPSALETYKSMTTEQRAKYIFDNQKNPRAFAAIGEELVAKYKLTDKTPVTAQSIINVYLNLTQTSKFSKGKLDDAVDKLYASSAIGLHKGDLTEEAYLELASLVEDSSNAYAKSIGSKPAIIKLIKKHLPREDAETIYETFEKKIIEALSAPSK